ncbi:hypothetical protein HYC85_000413 [Camellia sinensis]|uniref:CCR4-NOT transcription complex subunit 1 HEAT repeat domain-containing protein n=1 Tax=Camellia sinensis TaxID=4442 RepID=A0A7J7I494_CAMSI|nr:hypothetical protein HYC85_000413 [Camellia sinensis]
MREWKKAKKITGRRVRVERSCYIGYGTEGSMLLLQTCLDHLNIYGRDLKNMQLEPIFGSIFKYILDKPNFSTVLSESLRSTVINEDFLESLSNALNLSATEKIGIGLALSDSENLDISMCGKNFCMAQIEELFASHACVDSAEQIQNIFMFLHRSEGLSKHVDSFMQMLSLVQLNEGDRFILAPFLLDELREATFLRNFDLFDESNEDDFDAVLAEMEKEMSMADILKELGYGCTVNVSQCIEMLSLFLPLTEITVSRIFGTIARTHAGLEDNQNAFSTFYSALVQAPETNWISVVENLDHEGFYFPNEAAFSFFMSVYKRACQGTSCLYKTLKLTLQDPFPLHAICGSVCKNTEGQLSFLKNAVAVPPEVFTFANAGRGNWYDILNHNCQIGICIAYVDAVHGLKFQPGHANHAWLCLDLLEVLCLLAERGHASAVQSMLKHPLEHCPEVLLLGMAHINTAYNFLQYEVSSIVFTKILKNSTGSGMVLHLWHVNPNLLVQSFLDARNIDPNDINRVLDICQELKILLPVLDMVPSYFGIRLAAIASQKELLDLEKWLSYNLGTYRDIFFEECHKFLKEIQFCVYQDVSTDHLKQSGALWNLYLETSPIFLKVLQAHMGLIISSQLFDELEKLCVTFMHANSRMKNGGATDSSPSDGYADDIETEANSYFHQMFSGQLTIDTDSFMYRERERIVY